MTYGFVSLLPRRVKVLDSVFCDSRKSRFDGPRAAYHASVAYVWSLHHALCPPVNRTCKWTIKTEPIFPHKRSRWWQFFSARFIHLRSKRVPVEITRNLHGFNNFEAFANAFNATWHSTLAKSSKVSASALVFFSWRNHSLNFASARNNTASRGH